MYIYSKKFIFYFMEIEKTLFRVHEKFLTKEEAPKVLNISVYVWLLCVIIDKMSNIYSNTFNINFYNCRTILQELDRNIWKLIYLYWNNICGM